MKNLKFLFQSPILVNEIAVYVRGVENVCEVRHKTKNKKPFAFAKGYVRRVRDREVTPK